MPRPNQRRDGDPVFEVLRSFAENVCLLRRTVLENQDDRDAYFDADEENLWEILEHSGQMDSFRELRTESSKALRKAAPQLGGDCEAIDTISWDADIVHNTLFGLAYQIWCDRLPDSQISEAARAQATSVHELVSEFGKWHARKWVACIPLERLFARFPEFTDFGRFQILNPSAESLHNPGTTDALQHLLRKYVGVNFVDATEIETSYASQAEEIIAASNGYIAGRPQLVLKLFDEPVDPRNRHPIIPEHAIIRLRQMLSVLVPLLRLCQVAYEELHEEFGGDPQFGPTPAVDYWKSGEWSTLPDGTVMQHRYVEMPDKVLLIDQGTGTVPDSLFSLQYRTNLLGMYVRPPLDRPEYALAPSFETNYGEGYSAESFMSYWNRYALPILALRDACAEPSRGKLPGELQSFLDAIDNAVLMVASCVHRIGGNFAAQCVMGAESILNPYKENEGLAARFAMFSACLRSSDMEQRRKLFREAQRMYKLRSVWAHGSGTPKSKEKGSDIDEPKVLKLFLECLLPVVTWANERLVAGDVINKESIRRLFEEKLFPVA